MTGCYDAPQEAKDRLAAVKAQAQEYDAALDEVEERLLGNQASVKLWKEMAWRHGRVQQVACQNLATHAEGMQRFIAKEEKKARKMRRNRVAAEVSAAPVKGKKSRRNN